MKACLFLILVLFLVGWTRCNSQYVLFPLQYPPHPLARVANTLPSSHLSACPMGGQIWNSPAPLLPVVFIRIRNE